MIKLVILIWSLILTTFTSIFNLGTININNTEYEVKLGSQYLIDYTIIGEVVNLNFESLNNSIVIVDQNGLMHGIKIGNAQIKIYYNETSSLVDVKVIKENDTTINTSLNKLNYGLLSLELSKYLNSNLFKNGINYNINYKIKSKLLNYDISINQKIKDNYIEMTKDDNTYIYILEDNICNEYILNDDGYTLNNHSSEYFNEVKVFKNSLTKISLDLTTCSIKLINDNYYINMYYKDLIKIKQFSIIKESLESYNLNSNNFNNTMVYLKIKISNYGINIDISFTNDIKVLFINTPLFVGININISKENIKELKL